MIFWLLSVLFIIALFLEATVTTLPLTFVILLILLVFSKKPTLFFLAFTGGVVLDMLTVQMIGKTSLFFSLMLLLLFLYQRKYEIRSLPFVTFASFICSVVLLVLAGVHQVIIQAVVSMGIAMLLFMLLNLIIPKEKNSLLGEGL